MSDSRVTPEKENGDTQETALNVEWVINFLSKYLILSYVNWNLLVIYSFDRIKGDKDDKKDEKETEKKPDTVSFGVYVSDLF